MMCIRTDVRTYVRECAEEYGPLRHGLSKVPRPPGFIIIFMCLLLFYYSYHYWREGGREAAREGGREGREGGGWRERERCRR